MSQLDDILTDLSKLQAQRQIRIDPDEFTVDMLAVNNTKENIKYLMLEIIGEDDDWDSEIRKYQSEMRQKVKEL